MPTANWLQPPTPAGGYAPEPEPRGLLGFLGAGPDFGADVGDRLGVISQILMNLGSGRGGAGIAEATAAVNSRGEARRERRKAERMVARMADKLEGSNPEMAAAMRANTEFGMRMLGKMYESQWDSTNRMAELNKQYELEGGNQIALANRKAELEAQSLQNTLRMAGLSASLATTPDAGVPTSPATPDAGPVLPSTGGTGADIGTEPAPVVVPEQLPPAQPNVPPEYLANLPPGQIGQVVLRQRLMHQDPEIGVDEVNAYIMAMTSQNEAGRQKYFDNIAKRKEVQARVREFGAGANEMARQNQALPGINLQTPGQPELMQARIPLDSVPLGEQPQAAEYLKQSVKEGDYKDALKSFLPRDSGGFSITTNPETGEVTVASGKGAKGATEGQVKAGFHYNNAIESMPILEDPVSVDQLTSGYQPIVEGIAPEALSNFVSTDEFLLAKTAARSFIESVVRLKSGAQITPHEEELNSRIFIPRLGEKGKPKTIAFKKALREAAVQGIHDGMSPQQILLDGYRKTNEAKAKGLLEDNKPVIPPMEPWAIKAGITQEQWNRGTPELWFPDIGEKQ